MVKMVLLIFFLFIVEYSTMREYISFTKITTEINDIEDNSEAEDSTNDDLNNLIEELFVQEQQLQFNFLPVTSNFLHFFKYESSFFAHFLIIDSPPPRFL